MTAKNSGDTRSQKQLELIERRSRVAQMYKDRKSQWEIANTLGVDQATVSRDLKQIKKVLLEEQTDLVALRMLADLEKLDWMEREATEAWLRSIQPTQVNDIRKNEYDRGGKKTIHTTTHMRKIENTGDPRFLAEIGKIVKQRADILGYEAPKKLEIEANLQQSGSVILLPQDPTIK